MLAFLKMLRNVFGQVAVIFLSNWSVRASLRTSVRCRCSRGAKDARAFSDNRFCACPDGLAA